jgi:hypothetical protein
VESKRILDIKTSTLYDEMGNEIKEILLKWGCLTISLKLTETQVNHLLRELIKEKGSIPLAGSIHIPPKPISKTKYIKFDEDFFNPRRVEK